ncbi:serine hydroxymethyltransferase [Theileria orientalis strain Shintoku]|uniref:Serine hydroxymethyltransferase n=1 Tax=Theileria orientalis strain Shintoku TaxID=869250 RepID=J4CC71_THEOR|nr:serine hydroxymethyltransferase [Theileria orientalis strain Shintoku]PVC52688.1 serine hydroxymethyltransferase [Theileria orientalis]BAM38882.1 serine hydroxymethyltransferase [Theileria orientalis strain Shintoku]|eukprot:XP_009689183.1 serine hydroxymethyltransferase [Theileria orientalis strain Shintoku]
MKKQQISGIILKIYIIVSLNGVLNYRIQKRSESFERKGEFKVKNTLHKIEIMSSKREFPLEDDAPLKEFDPEVHGILEKERNRQRYSVDLIASENYASRACLEALGSVFTNKYSEGYPGRRYYGGCKHVDELETLCMQRCLQVFGLPEEDWGVNVQALSGSPANFAVYCALLEPHDKLMGLSLMGGGHLTHGYYIGKKKISASSIFFSPLSYTLDPETGLIDYKELEKLAKLYCPRLIIAGASTYTRHIDYKRFREIADSVDAYLMADIAHISGLVAAGVHPSPFEHCHVVTSTTHKSLKGPRSGMIFYNKKLLPEFGECINNAVFPTLQGGPHNNKIAALAVQLRQMLKPEWKAYAQSVVDTARTLASELERRSFKILTGGTDNHTVIVDLRPFDVTGSKMQIVCELVNLTISKSTLPGDKSALNPSGIRLGTPALVSRGAKREDMEFVAEALSKAVDICVKVQAQKGKKLVDFKVGLEENEEVLKLRSEVVEWVSKFPYVD